MNVDQTDMKDKIKQSVRDAIDHAVNEKAKEKGYANEEDSDNEEESSDDEEESDSDLIPEDLEISEQFPEHYRDALDVLALIETETGDASELSEASRRKAAAIGAVVGAIAAPGFGAVTAPIGAAIGASLAKGKQKTLEDQISAMQSKIRQWQSNPSDANREKIQRAQDKIQKWESHLSHLKSTGRGKAGILRRNK